MNADRLLEHFERISDAADAVPRLRRFVLDLAVRGQLIRSTHTRDVNAAALLESRLPPRKQPTGRTGADLIPVDRSTSPHIPDSWQWARLYQLCDLEAPIVYGILQPGPDIGDHGVPYIRPSEISNGEIELHNIRHTSPEIAARYSRSQICTGDVVFTIVGTLGATATVPEALDGGNITQSSCRLRADKQLIETRYLLAALHSSIVAEQISTFRLGTAVPRLNIAHVRAIAIPLPPLVEQHRIVAKVDELMALCDRLEAAQAEREARRDRLVSASLARVTEPDAPDATPAKAPARFHLDHFARLTTRPEQVKQLRQTILNLAVRGRLVLQDPAETPFAVQSTADVGDDPEKRMDLMLPKGWQWVRVRDVAEARLGKMLDKAKNRGRQYKYLRNTNVHWFEVRTDEVKTMPLADDEVASFLLKEGDVLICEGGHGIARTAVWRGEIANIAFQKALHRVRPGKALHGDFFAFCINVYFHANILQRLFTGVGIPHFTGVALSKLVFPLPPLAEQRRIVAKVDELMALCDQLDASLASASTDRVRLLEALLHEALAPAA